MSFPEANEPPAAYGADGGPSRRPAVDPDARSGRMNAMPRIATRRALRRRLAYIAKAAAAIAVLYAIGAFAEILPAFAIAAIWALLTCATTVAVAYPYVIKRINTAGMFRPGSAIHRRINGRMFLLLVCFAISALFTASLILDMQRWDGRAWLATAAAVPLYSALHVLVAKASRTQYLATFQDRGTMLWSLGVTAVFLGIVYLLILILAPSNGDASLGETFSATRQLFANSPSALMAEAGKWEYVLQCLTAFGFGQAEKAPFVVWIAISLVSCFFTSLAIAHLLSLCSLDRAQLLRVFLPLGETQRSSAERRTVCASLATLAVLSAALVGGFIIADEKTHEATQTNGYAAFEDAVREQAGIVAYEVDGKAHAAQTVYDAMDQTLQSDADAKLARDELVRAVNESYDACEKSVDGYLDWYFNPFTGIERFINLFGNSAGDRLREEYLERVGKSLESGDLAACISIYNDTRDSLRSRVEASLESSPLYGIPAWIVADMRTLDEFPQLAHLDQAPELLEPDGEFTGLITDRDTYRDAIVDAIEKSRSDTLARIE